MAIADAELDHSCHAKGSASSSQDTWGQGLSGIYGAVIMVRKGQQKGPDLLVGCIHRNAASNRCRATALPKHGVASCSPSCFTAILHIIKMAYCFTQFLYNLTADELPACTACETSCGEPWPGTGCLRWSSPWRPLCRTIASRCLLLMALIVAMCAKAWGLSPPQGAETHASSCLCCISVMPTCGYGNGWVAVSGYRVLSCCSVAAVCSQIAPASLLELPADSCSTLLLATSC